MNYRKFAGINAEPSLLGFGLMRLPLLKENEQAIDRLAAKRMVEEALRLGINYFDTAYPYHQGESELFIGEALRGVERERFYLANKLPIWEIKTRDDVRRIFHEQLQKCQVDYFDFYLLHALDQKRIQTIEEMGIYDIMQELKGEGKIRHLGFSFHDAPGVFEAIIMNYDWDFAQIQLNYLDWEMQDAERKYKFLEGQNIPVIVMEPLRGGALANLDPALSSIFHSFDPKRKAADWGLRFVAELPQVMTVLSGMSTMEQLRENAATFAGLVSLTREEKAVIEEVKEKFIASSTVPCTACRYCMDCPFSVNIPGIFRVYNEFCFTQDIHSFASAYAELGSAHQATACTRCEACVPLCPQNIAIPDMLADIHDFYSHYRLTKA